MTLLVVVLCALLAVSGLLGLYAWARVKKKTSAPRYVCDVCDDTDCTCRPTDGE